MISKPHFATWVCIKKSKLNRKNLQYSCNKMDISFEIKVNILKSIDSRSLKKFQISLNVVSERQ